MLKHHLFALFGYFFVAKNGEPNVVKEMEVLLKNTEYWAQRFAQIEDAEHRKAMLIAANVYDIYEDAKREVNKKIALWYVKFDENNNNDITLAKAKQWLLSKELEEFKWDVWGYIKHGEENAIDQSWMKQLENAFARVHISKYEALKIQMQQSLEELAAKYQDVMREGMKAAYQSTYYHTAFEVQKGFEVGFDITGVDQNLLEKILSKPWAVDGLNFSDRIWKNKQLLVGTLDRELTQGLIIGKSPQKIINAVSDKMNVSRIQAGRLIMTESAYFGSLARRDCFKELDVDKYVIVATLDSRTSEICRELDGKIYQMKDYKVGVTAPPFHVLCRTTIAPYFEDMRGIGERSARDENGKSRNVPKDLSYREWKKRFADKALNGSQVGLTAVNADDKINYARLIDVLRLDCDDTESKFTRQNIIDELRTSIIGKRVASLIENNPVQINLCNAPQMHSNRGMQMGDSITLFLQNIKSGRALL